MPPDPAPDTSFHLSVTEGRAVSRLNGESTVVKLEPEWTRGAYALRSNTAPPRFTSVPLHRHRDMEEAFVIVAGTMSIVAAAGGDPSLVDDAAMHAVHERYGLEILGPPPEWDDPPSVTG